MKRTCPSPGCGRAFRSSTALYFHVVKEHPSGASAYRGELREAGRLERIEDKTKREIAAQKRLNAFYRDPGCPCGKTVSWHLEQQKRAGGRA